MRRLDESRPLANLPAVVLRIGDTLPNVPVDHVSRIDSKLNAAHAERPLRSFQPVHASLAAGNTGGNYCSARVTSQSFRRKYRITTGHAPFVRCVAEFLGTRLSGRNELAETASALVGRVRPVIGRHNRSCTLCLRRGGSDCAFFRFCVACNELAATNPADRCDCSGSFARIGQLLFCCDFNSRGVV